MRTGSRRRFWSAGKKSRWKTGQDSILFGPEVAFASFPRHRLSVHESQRELAARMADAGHDLRGAWSCLRTGMAARASGRRIVRVVGVSEHQVPRSVKRFATRERSAAEL